MQAKTGKTRWLLASCAAIAAACSLSARAQEIPAVTPENLAALIAGNEGKVVVVNFWATWCPPCLREFPDIIDVYNRYRDDGLEVLAVSMNYPEEMADIEEFLQNFDPPFPVLLAATVDETFYEAVLDSWYGEMPMTLIFDTAGNRVHIHKRPVTYPELATEVLALLPSS